MTGNNSNLKLADSKEAAMEIQRLKKELEDREWIISKTDAGLKTLYRELEKANASLEIKVRERTKELAELNKDLSQELTEHKRVEHDLKERVKELTCLYGVSKVTGEADTNLDKMLQQTVDLIPDGWQYPEITCARIILSDKEFKTDKFRTTQWKQSADISIKGRKEGTVEVYYLEEKPEAAEGSFLAEERDLINGIAKLLGEVAERKQAEEQTRQSEENLKAYLENAPDAVYLNDLKGTFLYGNKKAEELTGYKKEELIGQSFLKLNLLPAKYLAKAGKLLALNAVGRPTGPDEFELMRRDGKLIWVEINTTPIKQAEGKVIIGFVRDITERKKTEQKIKHAAEEWRATFDSIADLVSIQDKDFRLVRVNKAYAEFFNMKPQELIGKTCYEVVHKRNEPMPNCPLKETMKSKKPVMMEFFEPHLGTYREVSTSPMFDEQGAVIGCVHITKDITQRKQADERLIVTDRLASVGEMASGVAHELNNPLTSVIGLSQLVMEGDVPDDVKEDVGTIYSEAQRAAGVVKNLLTFARKHTPVRQLTRINRIIDDVLKLRAYEHRVNNIQVNTHFDPELPECMVDYFQVQQVFLNIILNAESAMLEAHNKGTLTITTQRVNNTIKVSLSDDGPGITKETLSRIFDPFFTTKEVGKGTGLGLSICYGIVTEHNGKIYAKSVLGRGATFVVELPLMPIN